MKRHEKTKTKQNKQKNTKEKKNPKPSEVYLWWRLQTIYNCLALMERQIKE